MENRTWFDDCEIIPEPLKNKRWHNYNYNLPVDNWFTEKDIASAVEWLKNNIAIKNATISQTKMLLKIFTKIDEAFADVTKQTTADKEAKK